MVKIGRRGSWSATLTVTGTQGHSAYPDKADNPLRGMVTLLSALMDPPLDAGSERFAPSTLEVVSVDVGNPAAVGQEGGQLVVGQCQAGDRHGSVTGEQTPTLAHVPTSAQVDLRQEGDVGLG